MRILVVEDEPLIARALREGLSAEGYTVDVADRGDDGFWMATENEYEAIVLDIMLPAKNGYEICRDLRADGNTTPIMMLTAKDGDLDQAEGLDLGADDYVVKPFSLVVVAARLRAMIRRGPTERTPVLTAGDLELDQADRKVTRAGQPIELTPREYSLLRYLMHRAGEPVSKQELIDNVWSDEMMEANVVQVYVGYLRRKIDEPFGRSSIETMRGFGYRLAADGG